MLSRLTLACAAALVLCSAGCKKKMEDFTSTEYKFKARFPGKPKVESQSPHGVPTKMFAVERSDGIYGVAVSDMPIPANESEAMIQTRLDGARDGAIRNIGGVQKSSSAITLNGKYPGREFTASITKPKQGQVRARVFLVGTRLYQVMVMGTDSYATSAEANEFLNSFDVLE
jgi:hypothetical protein